MEMWRFETKQFSIIWEIDDCFDLDLSWCETGETREKINSGEWHAFDSKVYVEWNGQEIGAAYLGQSIYANPAEFRDHIGMNAKGHGSLFSDMVREAISEARSYLIGLERPYVRAA